MANTKITDAAGLTVNGAMELPVNNAGSDGKVTVSGLTGYADPMWTAITSAQGAGFASDTYITGSRVVLPQSRMQAGVIYRAQFVFTKTGAGLVAPIFTVRIGTAATTSDTSVATLTGLTNTAVIDTGSLDITITFRSVGSGTSAVVNTFMRWTHDLATTGMGNAARIQQTNTVSSGFNSTTTSQGIGLSLNAGTSAAWTVQQANTELFNLIP